MYVGVQSHTLLQSYGSHANLNISVKIGMTTLTFKWKNRNQILIEFKKEETEHFCVKLYGLIVNSCSLEEECTFDAGRSKKPNFPHISCSGLLRRHFEKFPIFCRQWDPPLPSYSKLPILCIYSVELQVLGAFFSVELFLHGQPYCLP